MAKHSRSNLIAKMLTPMWVLHILLDVTLVTSYFVFVHPPTPETSLEFMFIELAVVLGVADILTHYTLNYD